MSVRGIFLSPKNPALPAPKLTKAFSATGFDVIGHPGSAGPLFNKVEPLSKKKEVLLDALKKAHEKKNAQDVINIILELDPLILGPFAQSHIELRNDICKAMPFYLFLGDPHPHTLSFIVRCIDLYGLDFEVFRDVLPKAILQAGEALHSIAINVKHPFLQRLLFMEEVLSLIQMGDPTFENLFNRKIARYLALNDPEYHLYLQKIVDALVEQRQFDQALRLGHDKKMTVLQKMIDKAPCDTLLLLNSCDDKEQLVPQIAHQIIKRFSEFSEEQINRCIEVLLEWSFIHVAEELLCCANIKSYIQSKQFPKPLRIKFGLVPLFNDLPPNAEPMIYPQIVLSRICTFLEHRKSYPSAPSWVPLAKYPTLVSELKNLSQVPADLMLPRLYELLVQLDTNDLEVISHLMERGGICANTLFFHVLQLAAAQEFREKSPQLIAQLLAAILTKQPLSSYVFQTNEEVLRLMKFCKGSFWDPYFTSGVAYLLQKGEFALAETTSTNESHLEGLKTCYEFFITKEMVDWVLVTHKHLLYVANHQSSIDEICPLVSKALILLLEKDKARDAIERSAGMMTLATQVGNPLRDFFEHLSDYLGNCSLELLSSYEEIVKSTPLVLSVVQSAIVIKLIRMGQLSKGLKWFKAICENIYPLNQDLRDYIFEKINIFLLPLITRTILSPPTKYLQSLVFMESFFSGEELDVDRLIEIHREIEQNCTTNYPMVRKPFATDLEILF